MSLESLTLNTKASWLTTLYNAHLADLKFAFQLVEQDQPGIIFYTISNPEKNEWMAALTMLLTRR